MAAPWQISRAGALWLVVAFAVCIAPLAAYLPLWVPGVAALAALWRLGIHSGRWGAPGWGLKAALALVCVAGLVLSFRRLQGLEPMVSLLVCAFSLKLLEMRQRRDALVVIFLGYFVAIVLALFDQGMLVALYILAAMVVVSASLVGLHQSAAQHSYRRPLRTALYIFLPALPLAIVFFLVMPRLGPLWGVPAPGVAVTGMSDSLRLGQVASLSGSSAIAFRAEFEGEVPPREQRYWRGVTLSHFDGESWERAAWWSAQRGIRWTGDERRDDPDTATALDYRVILEKTGGTWLYSLAYPQALTANTGVAQDFTLVSRSPVTRRTEYQVRSFPDRHVDRDGLGALQRRVETQLPENSNPRTRRLAAAWAAETPEPRALIERLLRHYHRGFSYTLTPPSLGQHAVDDFLFSSRAGFCEHFAASFVFFMRAAGVPARIVGGYQGGELDEAGNYLVVRQYDAHAWAEVWLEGEGWARVDPTAAVAPERILSNLLSMMSADVVFANSPLDLARFQGVPLINQLRLRMERLEYQWARWVLGYDTEQSNVLARLLGGLDPLRIATFVLLASALCLAPVLFAMYPGRRRGKHVGDQLYAEFCARLARAGCERARGEGPRDFAARASRNFPADAAAINSIRDAYLALRYGPGSGDVAHLRRLVKGFRV
ncbi:MAG: DUF3488 and transglutaminase-like domain-containing protein [Porticoccaceae bacterium]